MARNFTPADSSRLSITSTLGLTAYPVTVSLWFRAEAGVTASLWSHSNASISEFIRISTTVGGDIRAATNDGITSTFANQSGYSTDGSTWNHAVARWASATDRRIMLDGTEGTDSTSSGYPTASDRVVIGASTSGSLRMDGDMAEVAVWDVTLTDDEALALSNGASAFRVQRQNLIAYWNLFGDSDAGDRDASGGGNNVAEVLTVAAVQAHAPVAPPYAHYQFQPMVTAAPVFTNIRGRQITGGVGHGA